MRLARQSQAALHKATLIMKLDFFQFVKLFSHNQAMYRPMQRQAGQSEVIRRAVKANVKVMLPRRAWTAWCKDLTVVGAAPARAPLQVLKEGQAVRRAIREKENTSGSRPAAKRRKAAAPPLPKSLPTRRTPFRLRNSSPVIRPGRKFKKI